MPWLGSHERRGAARLQQAGTLNRADCRRADRIEEAVVFAQSSLAPLRGLLSSRQSVSDAMLHEVVALLAYEDPMVGDPVFHFAGHKEGKRCLGGFF